MVMFSNACFLLGKTLPDNILAAPLLISTTNTITGANATASGFYLEASNHVFLCTAAHVFSDDKKQVVFTDARLTQHSWGDTNTLLSDVTIHLNALNSEGQIRFNLTHDVAVIRLGPVGTNGKPLIPTRYATENESHAFVSMLVCVRQEQTSRLTNVDVGDDVFVFGYPNSIGILHALGVQQSPRFDYSAPLLRKGIVAGIYRDAKTITIDATVYFGNSGGPVFEVDRSGFNVTKYSVIGVVTELIPFYDESVSRELHSTSLNVSNSGYSVVQPIDFIFDLLWPIFYSESLKSGGLPREGIARQ
jgi:hypothetical protein